MLHTLTYKLHEVVPYINWLYFFHAWGLPSKFGGIVRIHDCQACRQTWITSFAEEERAQATEAAKLYNEAKRLLLTLDEKFQTYARVLLTPAYSDGEDIVIRKDDGTEQRLPLLRQQSPSADGYCWCLSDYIQPNKKDCLPSSTDNPANAPHNWIGLFVSTVDQRFEQQHNDDPFLKFMHQTLADRLAEATAEKAHEEVRKRLWGYAADEDLTTDELFCEKYQGRRPAVGYPSLPDQSINFLLADLLHYKELGIELTENGAMRPHSSTSGLMIAHPKAHHFSIGKISDEQLTDYARRRGLPEDRIRSFLCANL